MREGKLRCCTRRARSLLHAPSVLSLGFMVILSLPVMPGRAAEGFRHALILVVISVVPVYITLAILRVPL